MPGSKTCQTLGGFRLPASHAYPQRPQMSTLAVNVSRKARMSAKKSFNLEKSLADLEDLVEELESGDLPLEKAMKKFEEGIKLTRGCQAALKDAEQKVAILLQDSGGEELEEFDFDADEP